MIEKILDNYYSKKLIQFIKDTLSDYICTINIKCFDYKNYMTIKIKRSEYNDEQYMQIYYFKKINAFEFMCRNKELGEMLRNRVKEYLEENKI